MTEPIPIRPDGYDTKPAFDLSVFHSRQVHGDVVIWISWDRITGEPCLIITPNINRPGHERITPCVIPLSEYWVWNEMIGDEERCAMTLALFSDALGLNSTRRRVVGALYSAIRAELDELRKCPPMPRDDREKVAEMLVRDNATGKESTKEISDHV